MWYGSVDLKKKSLIIIIVFFLFCKYLNDNIVFNFINFVFSALKNEFFKFLLFLIKKFKGVLYRK